MADAASPAETGGRYRNILVPTDGSEGSRRGVEHALDLGSQYEARLHVLHVVDERRQAQTPALGSEELLLEKLEDHAREVMDDIVAEATTLGLETVTECARGVPHDEITAYARGNDIDLIVMGIHGLGETDRPHIGSTTDRVLRTADIPVLPV